MAIRRAEKGDKVAINLTGRFPDGTVFDTTEDDVPFIFTIGFDDIIPGIDAAVEDMAETEVKVVKLLPDDAFGHRDESLVIEVPKSDLDFSEELQEGNMYEMSIPGDETSVLVTIARITENTVFIDANDPLAGEELIYEIELIKIY